MWYRVKVIVNLYFFFLIQNKHNGANHQPICEVVTSVYKCVELQDKCVYNFKLNMCDVMSG
jgi:hypothetical protein